MARILITSGPTRQFLDPVRYLTNASSGRMGAALARAAIEVGHEVVVVTGPVAVNYPDAATLIPVVTTDEMLQAVLRIFPACDGLIGAAAPCDYMPHRVHPEKIAKSGQPLVLELIETPDVVATAAQSKRPDQWVVGFALETEDVRFRALAKMERKCCDCIVSNDASAIDAEENSVEILGRDGVTLGRAAGPKADVARIILQALEPLIAEKRRAIPASPPTPPTG